METEQLGIERAFSFTPPVFRDDRGLFTTPFQGRAFRQAVGRPLFEVGQVSHNLSAAGVLRGIHYTATPPGKAKYVYCPHGRVTDFLVDLRLGSPTFGRWAATRLDGDNGRATYIPVGVGHAFLAEEDASVVVYVMPGEYVPANELPVSPLDDEIGLPLPDTGRLTLSERDTAAPGLREAEARGLLPRHADCLAAEAAL